MNTNINTNTKTNTKINDNIPYNIPKTVIKKYNYMNNIREIKEKKIQFKIPFKDRIERNKNRNLFNSKTTRNYPTYYTNKTLTSINNKEIIHRSQLLNKNYKINNKENISFNMKQSVLSDLSDISGITNINNINTKKIII